TEEWDKVSEGQAVQGCLVVSKKAITEHKAVVDAFLDEYKASVDFVNGNIADASQMIADIGIVGAAAVAQKAIPRCNIVYIDGDAMIASLTEFYTVLYNANPKSVGGTLPNESLYYKK
ncbi:MAG: ABC transporter substrate-binding protein, partial [Clostridia bacterium]|nr:ABC transporter substrate-binding protein [Clostridia bacterium]